MYTTRCWMCPLVLAVVMLLSASEVDSIMVGFSCCPGGQSKEPENIQRCYEQKPRSGCNSHAFVIITSSNKRFCIRPTPPWLQKKLHSGEISCPPEFQQKGKVEVLEKDVVE